MKLYSEGFEEIYCIMDFIILLRILKIIEKNYFVTRSINPPAKSASPFAKGD
jgi:hypothetical protein